MTSKKEELLSERERKVFDSHLLDVSKKTDRIFAGMFIFQWLFGIILALWLSPLAWEGTESKVHLHVYAAFFLGGLAALFPVALMFFRAGHYWNRYYVAVSQVFFSILFIHLSGGRIETHFHVFGSLAFLAFYRDFRPVLLATILTAADHLLRGMFWPQSVYGVLSASPLRALEHAAWVIFEVTFLFISIRYGLEELRLISKQRSDLETVVEGIEKKVQERTEELLESKRQIISQQEALMSTAKMSALGEMAGGVAHEINSPLAIISMRVEQLEECLADNQLDLLNLPDVLISIKKSTERVAKIVNGLRFFARDGSQTKMEIQDFSGIIEDTLGFCKERFSNHGIELRLKKDAGYESLRVECRRVEISQVLLSLLNNAFDAIADLNVKWIEVNVADKIEFIELSVMDSGNGISKEVQDKMMAPFFTTKPIGKGTGLGLSISRGMIDSHGGKLCYNAQCSHTQFTILLPKLQNQKARKETAA